MIIAKTPDAVIVPKYLTHYSEETFNAQRKENFIECESAEELLHLVKPWAIPFMPGLSLIAVDTETFYTGVPNNRLPAHVVRRWIKEGSKYFPNDFPFCISVCDGVNSFALYDTLENGFKEFAKLEPLLSDTTIAKVFHNTGYDLHMLANAKCNILGRLLDTMILSKLTRADAFTHNLFDIAKEMQTDMPSVLIFQQMVDSYKAEHRITDYRDFPKELMTQYTCADTWNTFHAFAPLYKMMVENGQQELFEIESETLLVAYWMERTGLRLDADVEDVLIPELEAEVNEAERKIYEEAGCTFNINSGKQLMSVLAKLGYGHLVKIQKPTATMMSKGVIEGNPCFNSVEMERLELEGVPLIEDIMIFRKAEKLLNTFARKLYDMCDATSTIHCNINTIEAKTGRFSISSPSMQNMPRRNDSRVRDAFIAPEGYTLFDFDFKAQESIILTHFSRCQYLMDIVNSGGDIHTAVAGLVYSIDYKDVTRGLREVAKSVEFAMVYGAGAPKVAQMTKLSLLEAQTAIKTLLKNAPEIDMFIRQANQVAKQRRFIYTILRRIIYVERYREYACVNYAIQGSAADCTKKKMCLIFKFIRSNALLSRMVLQVHDSLLYTIHFDEEYILGYLRYLQTEREMFRAPILVDVMKCAPSWRNKEDYDVAEVVPPKEMMDNLNAYDIWKEGIL